MFKNYLKIALRNLFKQKIYSIINIFGLSLGLCCCILIMLYIQDELSFDRFHENADQIYRVVVEIRYKEKLDHFAHTPAPLAPAVLQEFPEILNAVRFSTSRSHELIAYQEKQFWEDGLIMADPSIFDVFTFPLSRGDPKTALDDPSAIVITESTARKYFGSQDPMGKVLKIGDDRVQDFKITGILRDIPSHSQLRFDFLISFANQRGNIEWGQWNYTTYIQLPSDYPPSVLEDKFPRLVGRYAGEEAKTNYKLHLQPLTRIHLHSNLRADLATNRDISHLYIFSGIGLLILMLACINFVNLVTARTVVREKEVGLRKVVGANRFQLLVQFLGEAVLLTLFAFLLSLILTEFLLPIFNGLTGKALTLHLLDDLPFMAVLITLMLVVGVLSGFYPAYAISRFYPISFFRKGFGEKASGHSILRKTLVVVQFFISIAFISSTAIMHRQMTYIKNKNLGYDKEHLVVFPIFYRDVHPQYELLKSEILKNPLIVNATATSYLPSKQNFYQNTWWEGLPEDDDEMMHWLSVDQDFIQTLGIEVKAGRDFSSLFPSARSKTYMLNEAAVKWIGWDNPVGKQFEILGRGTVIGVVNDFHFQSLHHQIMPLALNIYPEALRYLLVRIQARDIPKSLQFLKRKWEELFPSRPFDYSFFDEDFDRIYRSETQLRKTFNTISVLAILIASLGLFGLASFATMRRTKEIGIRKVMGASVSGIFLLLVKEFAKWVLVANIIAIPLAYFAMSLWLQNFAYRTGIGFWIFFLVAAFVYMIALLTVGYQAIKSATATPVEALRYE